MNNSSYSTQDTIFVQIASYRDSELQHTLQDLFKKAKRPENIFVGICHQYDMKEGTDKHLFVVPFPLKSKQIRIDEVDYREAKGCCWARNRVQKLWNGEKWTLMIDSHMRFEDGWDEILVTMYHDLVSQKYNPIITTYPAAYTLDGTLDKFTGNIAIKFDAVGTPFFFGGERLTMTKPIQGAFFAGGFCFGSSKIIKEVEYDKFIYFTGEEVTMAIRLWTLGYDIIVPDKIAAYHLYRVITDDPKLKVDRVISTDNDSSWIERDQIARKRVAHISKIVLTTDPQVLEDIERYQINNKRYLKDYCRFVGIDFRNKKVRERAKFGRFERWQEVANIDNIKNIFLSHREAI